MTHMIASSFALAAMLSVALPSAGVGESVPFNYGKLTEPYKKQSGSSGAAARKNSAAPTNTKLKVAKKKPQCDQATTMTAIALAESRGNSSKNTRPGFGSACQ